LRRITVTVPTTIDAGAWLGKYFEAGDADGDLPRAMLQAFAEALMSAQASLQCNAGYGERTDERENSRNGYRVRPWDTRVGTIDLSVPKLRKGVYSPEFLLHPRRRGDARVLPYAGVQVRVASLNAIVASKEHANRPKDQEALPELHRLQQQMRGTMQETQLTSPKSAFPHHRGPSHPGPSIGR